MRPYHYSHETIHWKKLVQLCPKEAYLLQAWLDANNVTQAELLTWYRYEDWGEVVDGLNEKLDLPDDEDGKQLDAMADNLKVLWDNLDKAFGKATKVKGQGLTLYAVCDDNDDTYWGVGNTTQRTPAGEKFDKDLHEVAWTEYG